MEQHMTTKKTTTIGWILSLIVIAFLLFDSVGKIIGIEQSVKATVELGYPENSISIIGLILLTSTTLYAIPRTSVLGLLFLTAYLGGAVATNFRVENPLFSHTLFPVYIGFLLWAGLLLRNKKIIQLINNK